MFRTPDERQQLFDRWAQTYEADMATADGPLSGYLESLEMAWKLLDVDAPATILDIGIGTGRFASGFVRDGIQIHGIDISPEMLKQCKELQPGFELQPGSFTSIPYDDDSFDTIISAFAFHEVPPAERQPAISEVARALKPGGWLCIVDIIFPSEEATADARASIGSLWDPDESYPLVADFDASLRQAGFESIRWSQTGPYHWAVVAQRSIIA